MKYVVLYVNIQSKVTNLYALPHIVVIVGDGRNTDYSTLPKWIRDVCARYKSTYIFTEKQAKSLLAAREKNVCPLETEHCKYYWTEIGIPYCQGNHPKRLREKKIIKRKTIDEWETGRSDFFHIRFVSHAPVSSNSKEIEKAKKKKRNKSLSINKQTRPKKSNNNSIKIMLKRRNADKTCAIVLPSIKIKSRLYTADFHTRD